MDVPRLRRNLLDAARLADERCSTLQLRVQASDDDDDDETAGLILQAAFQAGLSFGLHQAADAMGEVPASGNGLDGRAARAVVAEGGAVPSTPALPSGPVPEAVLDAVHVEHERVSLGLERRRLVEVADGLAGLVYASHLAAAAVGVRLEPLIDELSAAHLAGLTGVTPPSVDLVEHLVSQGWQPVPAC